MNIRALVEKAVDKHREEQEYNKNLKIIKEFNDELSQYYDGLIITNGTDKFWYGIHEVLVCPEFFKINRGYKKYKTIDALAEALIPLLEAKLRLT